MAQMDVEKEKDDLQVKHNKVLKRRARLEQKYDTTTEHGQSERPSGQQTTRSREAECNDDENIEMLGEDLPAASSPARHNAVAGPSRP
jgi:hypothetical protein